MIRDHLQLHFIVLLWGFTAILGLLITLPVVELVFLRTVMAGAMLWVVVKVQSISWKTSRKDFWGLLLTGVIFGAHWIFFFGSARESNVSVSLVGLSTMTLWTALLEPLIKREKKLHMLEVGIGLVIVLGIYLIFQADFSLMRGMVLALLSAVCAALFMIFNSRFTTKYNHYSIMGYEMLGASLALGVFLVADQVSIGAGPQIFKATPMDWLWLFILASVCTVYAYSISVKLMQTLTPYTINLVANLEPVYGIILALLIFGESEYMQPLFYVGALIILVAIFAYPVLNRHFFKASKATPQKSG